jgi:putative DNA methylase
MNQKLFIDRQVLVLKSIANSIYTIKVKSCDFDYSDIWEKAILSYLSISFDRLLSFNCNLVRWKTDAEAVVDAFARFSISILWDFAESNPVGESAGSWLLCYERIAIALDNYTQLKIEMLSPKVMNQSATNIQEENGKIDLIITDPPYYQAVSYADLSDFFYVWLRSIYPHKIWFIAGSCGAGFKDRFWLAKLARG